MEQNNNSKRKIIATLLVIIAVIIVVITAILAHRYIQEKNVEVLLDIWNEYRYGEYQNVLSLAETAPKPYDSYYKKIVSFRTELDSWSGTERELYEWLLTFERQIDIESIPENSYSDREILMENLISNLKELSNEKEWIESEFVWYPEFYQIRVEFYEKYFMLLIDNRELFCATPNDGIVSIPVSDITLLDSQMNKLLVASMQALDDLQDKYNIIEDKDYDIISREKEMMEKFKSDYDRSGAVSSHYDLTGGKYISFSADAAEENYNIYTQKIDAQLFDLSLRSMVGTAFNVVEGVPHEYEDYEGPIVKVLKIVYRIFPDSKLSLSELEYPQIYKVMHALVDDYIEG